MKILSVDISVPRDNAEYWRILNIAKIMKENGHEVDIVHYCRRSTYEKLADKEKYSNHKFVVTSPLGIHFKHLKLLRENKYDIVYANNSYANFSALLGKLTNVPLIFDMHGDPVQEFLQENPLNLNPKRLMQFIQKKLMHTLNLRLSDEILCVSHKMIDYLHENYNIPLEHMSYVTNGVDLEFFKPINNENSINLKNKLGLNGKLIFGYIGGFHKIQGINKFIEAARMVNDEDIKFLMVGGKELKEDNITFIPKINRSEILNYYSICDVLVLPRPHHPGTDMAAPTKFAEYTAMGKPILTTNIGDASDLVNKCKAGIVVEDNDVKNLIKGINEFRNVSDEELVKMGKNSRKIAENEFDWEKTGQNLLKSLEKFM